MENKNMRWFLLKYFILILVIVSVVERIFQAIINQLIWPLIEKHIFHSSLTSINMTTTDLLLFMLLILAEMIIMELSMGIPVLSNVSFLLQSKLDQIWMGFYVSNSEVHSLESLGRIGKIELAISSIAIISLVLAPYIFSAIAYSAIVGKEVRRLQEHEQQIHERHDRKRNLMLSDIAHDLRTPITTIGGYARALRDGMVTDSEKQKEYLEAIQKKSERMTELIQLLFEYSKLDSEGFKLEKKPIDLMELLRENAALIYPDMEESGMEFEVDIPESRFYVNADKVQVSRVITNLMNNAIRHTNAGSRILLSAKLTETECVIAVADSGERIPLELQLHLFEPFAMSDESRSSKGGSGLGLSIAAKVVRMHGWEIGLDNLFPEYTKAFVIRIPLDE